MISGVNGNIQGIGNDEESQTTTLPLFLVTVLKYLKKLRETKNTIRTKDE